MTIKVSKLTILLLKKNRHHFLYSSLYEHVYLTLAYPMGSLTSLSTSITLSLAMLKPWIITIPIIMMIMIMITIINNSWRQSFCDIRNNQGQGKCLKAELKAEADNTYRDLDDFRISQKPNLINYWVLLNITRKYWQTHHCKELELI